MAHMQMFSKPSAIEVVYILRLQQHNDGRVILEKHICTYVVHVCLDSVNCVVAGNTDGQNYVKELWL